MEAHRPHSLSLSREGSLSLLSVLEVLARPRGFSRFGVHPNKYTGMVLLADVQLR